MSRDPKRIRRFCNELAGLWETYWPDWRFGQLVVNALNDMPTDPFFVEEDEMLEWLRHYFDRTQPNPFEEESKE